MNSIYSELGKLERGFEQFPKLTREAQAALLIDEAGINDTLFARMDGGYALGYFVNALNSSRFNGKREQVEQELGRVIGYRDPSQRTIFGAATSATLGLVTFLGFAIPSYFFNATNGVFSFSTGALSGVAVVQAAESRSRRRRHESNLNRAIAVDLLIDNLFFEPAKYDSKHYL